MKFGTPQNGEADEAARVKSLSKRRSGKKLKPIVQAIQIQWLLYLDAIDDAKPLVRASLAKAWCDMEESKRKLRMKPLPGSLRPVAKQRKPNRSAMTPQESDDKESLSQQQTVTADPASDGPSGGGGTV